MNLRQYALNCWGTTKGVLEPARRHITLRNACRALLELVAVFTSDTFWVFVMAPFAAWAVALSFYAHMQEPDAVAKTVAAGPRVALQMWMVLAQPWIWLAIVARQYRRAARIVLAVVAISALQSRLPPAARARCQTDACHALDSSEQRTTFATSWGTAVEGVEV